MKSVVSDFSNKKGDFPQYLGKSPFHFFLYLPHEDHSNTEDAHNGTNDLIGFHFLLKQENGHWNDEDRHNGHEGRGNGSGGVFDGHERQRNANHGSKEGSDGDAHHGCFVLKGGEEVWPLLGKGDDEYKAKNS